MSLFRLSTLIMLLCLLFGIIPITSPPTIHAQSACPTFNGTTTTLTADCIMSAQETINSSTIINGNGYTIYAPGFPSSNDRHFTVNSGADLTLNNITLTEGSVTGNGGAIFNNGGTVDVDNSTFNNNEATQFGGAVRNFLGTMTITGSTFSGNKARWGGAVYNYASLAITSSTFSDNSVTSTGGAIFNDRTITVTNSTFSGNEANSSGGVLYNEINATVVVTNSILANSILNSPSGGNCTNYGTLNFTGMNIIDDDTCTTDTAVWTNADPLLAALANNGGPTQTMALQANSPAIDTVPAGTCLDADGNTLTTDQRGYARPYGAACDIGAFEWVITSTSTGDDDVVGPEWGDPFLCDSIEFVGGWGVYAEGTPEQTAYTVPDPPAGYNYASQPDYTGWCDVFTINQEHSPLPVEVCWPSTGATIVGLYHDQPDLTRAWTLLPTTQQGNNVCATLPIFGSVALLTGGTSDTGSIETTAPVNPPAENAVNCQVTTTNAVIFRDAPGGADIGRVMYDVTLHATAKSGAWYRVEWLGQQGWISADYVTAVCD